MLYFLGYRKLDDDVLFYCVDAVAEDIVIDKYDNIKDMFFYYWDTISAKFRAVSAKLILNAINKGECFYPEFNENDKVKNDKLLLIDYNPNTGARLLSTTFKAVLIDSVSLKTYLRYNENDSQPLKLINKMDAGSFNKSELDFYIDSYTKDIISATVDNVEYKASLSEMMQMDRETTIKALINSFEEKAKKRLQDAKSTNGPIRFEYPAITIYDEDSQITVLKPEENYCKKLKEIEDKPLYYITTGLTDESLKDMFSKTKDSLYGVNIVGVTSLLPYTFVRNGSDVSKVCNVFLPDGCGLERISGNTFYGCPDLVSLRLPNSIIDLEDGWELTGCGTHLKEVYVNVRSLFVSSGNRVNTSKLTKKVGVAIKRALDKHSDMKIYDKYTYEELTLPNV